MRTDNPCHPLKSAKSMAGGSALMITAVVVMAMVTVSAVFLNDVLSHTQLVKSYENNYLVRYAADAGLEQLKYQAKTSAYSGTRNIWLMNNSLPAGKLAINDLMINNIPVDVTLYDLTNGQYRAVAEAVYGRNTYRTAMEIKESEVIGLFRYAYVSTSEANGGALSLRKGGFADIIRGDIHANNCIGGYWIGDTPGMIQFGTRWNPGGLIATGAMVDGNVTAVNGVGSIFGDDGGTVFVEGDLANGSVTGAIDGHVAPVPFPTINQMSWDLRTYAASDYYIAFDNPLYAPYDEDGGAGEYSIDARITLITAVGTPTQIKLEFMSQITTTPETVLGTRTLPLPANKLIWVGNGAGGTVQGELNGRLTITGTSIRGDIRYVDNEGDRMYLLKKNGVTLSPAEMSASTEAWTAANGYTYTLNADYNPAVPANLTLQGSGGLNWTNPYNMEIHATLLSGYYNCGYAGGNKGNLKIVGSIASILGRNDGDVDNYYKLSTEMVYDTNLKTYAPEWYPTNIITVPSFSAWRRY